jgi:arylsulfatase A-like enzyme
MVHDPMMSRRAAVAGLAAAAGVAATPVLARSERRRPNILWLVSEDNNPFIGAYGDRLAHTPVIDQLARDGVLFKNVFSNAPVCAPSRFGIITGVYPESAGPAQNMRAVARLPAVLSGFPAYLRQAGYYCTNTSKTDYNSDLDPSAIWDESSDAAHWRNRPEDKPFFAVFNCETTHESRIFLPLAGRVKPQDVRLPAYLPDTPAIRRDYATYYNLMERMDGEIGARLAELDAAGLLDDTIVFYYSDNGGVLPRSKRYCFDEGLRCALVVKTPPRWRRLSPAAPGGKIDSPVSFIDLAPTVLALAGLPTPDHMQGRAFMGARRPSPARYAFGMRNRMDERYDMVRTVTDGRYRYIRNYSPHRIWGQHQAFAWMAEGYQSWEAAHLAGGLNPAQDAFWRTKPYEQFFDLKQDPDQVIDRLTDPKLLSRIDQMRRALDQHMLAVNDNGFIPEGSPLEGYTESRRPNAYPLQRIMALAATAAKRQPQALPYLVEMLGDPNEVIRYWATQGLLMLGDAAAPAQARLAEASASDPSPQVRIAAAEASARFGDSAAVGGLGRLLDDHPDVRVRLQALNALTFLGPEAISVRPAIARAATSDDEYLKNAGRYLILVLGGTYTPASPVYPLAEGLQKARQAALSSATP